MDLYTTIYQMCIQKAPNYTPQLYDRFGQSIVRYLSTVAVPAVASKDGVAMVREFVRRWNDHLLMKKWLCYFFCYLDRFYVKRYMKATLRDVCLTHFKNLMFEPLKDRSGQRT